MNAGFGEVDGQIAQVLGSRKAESPGETFITRKAICLEVPHERAEQGAGNLCQAHPLIVCAVGRLRFLAAALGNHVVGGLDHDQRHEGEQRVEEELQREPLGRGHGHDIDATTSPVEGGLTFALSKSRKERADFNGADRILKELADGPSRVRIGLIVKEGAPAREGAEIADADGNVIGKVTSGGPSPTLGKNIAMGFVPPSYAALGTDLKVIVRGRSAAAEVVAMPFVAQRYYRKPKA